MGESLHAGMIGSLRKSSGVRKSLSNHFFDQTEERVTVTPSSSSS